MKLVNSIDYSHSSLGLTFRPWAPHSHSQGLGIIMISDMWGNLRGDHWKPHHCWCQGLDLLGGLSDISSDTRKSESSKNDGIPGMRFSMLYEPGEKLLWAPLPHVELRHHSPEIFSKAFCGLMISALLSVCFVVLFTRPAWCFMPPGSYVQKPPTSTLGGTDDPNGTSQEPRGWLQQTVTPGTLSSSKPFQTTTFLVLVPEVGSACMLDDSASSPVHRKLALILRFEKIWGPEREKVHAVNQELQWTVEKLLLGSLKLVPKQPLTKPKSSTASKPPALVLFLSSTHGK